MHRRLKKEKARIRERGRKTETKEEIKTKTATEAKQIKHTNDNTSNDKQKKMKLHGEARETVGYKCVDHKKTTGHYTTTINHQHLHKKETATNKEQTNKIT